MLGERKAWIPYHKYSRTGRVLVPRELVWLDLSVWTNIGKDWWLLNKKTRWKQKIQAMLRISWSFLKPLSMIRHSYLKANQWIQLEICFTMKCVQVYSTQKSRNLYCILVLTSYLVKCFNLKVLRTETNNGDYDINLKILFISQFYVQKAEK